MIEWVLSCGYDIINNDKNSVLSSLHLCACVLNNIGPKLLCASHVHCWK